MEITEWTIYWITRLDTINTALRGCAIAFGIFGTLGIILSIILGLAAKTCTTEDDRKFNAAVNCTIRPMARILFLLFILFLSLYNLTPSTKEMCAIKVIPIVARDEQVQQLPQKMVNLADEWIEELRPQKDKQK